MSKEKKSNPLVAVENAAQILDRQGSPLLASCATAPAKPGKPTTPALKQILASCADGITGPC